MKEKQVKIAGCLLLSGAFLMLGGQGAFAGNDIEGTFLRERQVLELNRSLKNVIEENQRLVSRNETLEEKVSSLRGTTRQKSEKSYVQLAAVREIQSEGGAGKLSQRYDKTAHKDVPTEKVVHKEDQTLDLLSRIDAYTESDDRLKNDAAIAHYNMGNIYFHKGEYEIAAREYYQAVTLMPNDPDAHYNLAFVSGEHLQDFKTALKHYKMYVYLNPDAKDTFFVKEKIIDAELNLKSIIASPLETRKMDK